MEEVFENFLVREKNRARPPTFDAFMDVVKKKKLFINENELEAFLEKKGYRVANNIVTGRRTRRLEKIEKNGTFSLLLFLLLFFMIFIQFY
jgi:hypothetical protein